ncbi:MAG: hypothetical protein V3R59_00245 [Gammaproteobacteria bacterium]
MTFAPAKGQWPVSACNTGFDPGRCPFSELKDRSAVAILRFSIVTFVLFAGCATTITTMDGRTLALNSSEVREYVERVFREQNQAATALAFAQDDASGTRYETLLKLEDVLLEACAGLNELAAARRDDRALGLRQQARMAATAPSCESTTRRTRETLDAL